MKKINQFFLCSGLLLIGAILLTSACKEANPACQKFRTGFFRYEDPSFGGMLVKRSETIQIDSSPKIGLVTKFEITWVDDCSYVLKFKEIVANTQNIELPDLANMTRTGTMSEMTDSSYLEMSTSSLNENEMKSVMTRIGD